MFTLVCQLMQLRDSWVWSKDTAQISWTGHIYHVINKLNKEAIVWFDDIGDVCTERVKRKIKHCGRLPQWGRRFELWKLFWFGSMYVLNDWWKWLNLMEDLHNEEGDSSCKNSFWSENFSDGAKIVRRR